MQTSIWIAKFLGPIVLTLGFAMALFPKELEKTTKEFLADRPLILISGVLAMVAGLSIVNSHNYWDLGWPLIITLFGWALVLGGGLRVTLPSMVDRIGSKMTNHPKLTRTSGAFWGSLGAFLTYIAYIAV